MQLNQQLNPECYFYGIINTLLHVISKQGFSAIFRGGFLRFARICCLGLFDKSFNKIINDNSNKLLAGKEKNVLQSSLIKIVQQIAIGILNLLVSHPLEVLKIKITV